MKIGSFMGSPSEFSIVFTLFDIIPKDSIGSYGGGGGGDLASIWLLPADIHRFQDRVIEIQLLILILFLVVA